MHDLIFVSLEDWDEIWRRNQFLVSSWAKRFPEAKILFVGMRRRGKTATRILPDFPNVTVTNLPKILLDSWSFGRKSNNNLALRHVQSLARSMRMSAPILWLNPYDSNYFQGHLGEKATIYDITDDWALMADSPREKDYIQSHDSALCRSADATIVCSQALFDSRQTLAKRLALVPNGVDVAHYANVSSPPSNRRYQTPTLGYTGTVHIKRVDVDLVLRLAREFAHGDVVLVGPNVLEEAERARLKTQSNVHLVGAIPYAQIPDAMTQFDVCIVPHVESAFTESLNPIKLWEYLASGKPIVSTNVAGFRDYPQHVEIASGDEFAAACHRVLEAETEAKSAARRQEAQGHSWESRLDDVLKVVRDISEPKA